MRDPSPMVMATSSSELWGEIPPAASDNPLGLSPAEREAMAHISRPLPLEGPKIYQPAPSGVPSVKREPHGPDPLVTNTVELLVYKRQIDRLLEAADQYR